MKNAELLFIDGNIYTMDEAHSVLEAVATAGNKILYAGSKEEAMKLIDEKTKIISLKGKCLIPGFIDAHSHPILSAFFSAGMILDVDMTLDDIEKTIRKYIEENPSKAAYFGAGYPEWIFPPSGPKKEFLDEICREKPILLLGSGGHEGWANSIAFQRAGVDASFPDPIPNFHYFHRYPNGEPSGGLVETGTSEFMMKALNIFDEKLIEEKIASTVSYFNSIGITSVADCGSYDFMEAIGFPLLSDMKKKGKLHYRIFSCTFVAKREDAAGAVEKLKRMHGTFHDEHEFTVRTLKIINDGTMESRSASMTEPYGDSLVMSDPLLWGEELYDLCLEAAKEGFDIYIHAIGDRAIRETLMAAKAVREAGFLDTRITNAHTQYVKKEDRGLFGKYNVIANTTGSWHYGNTDLDAALSFRKDDTFTMKEILSGGAKISMGSDYPVDELGPEPLKAIEIAVTRQLFGQREAQVLEPKSERLTVMEALEGYTRSAAYQVRMESLLGSIEKGKFADLVILGEDLFEADPYHIHKIEVEMTVHDGKIVFAKQS